MKLNPISAILLTTVMVSGSAMALEKVPVHDAIWQYGQVGSDKTVGHSVSIDKNGRLYTEEFIDTDKPGEHDVGFSVFDTVKKEKKWFISLTKLGAESNQRSMLITAPIIDSEHQQLWIVTRDSRIYLYDISKKDEAPTLINSYQIGERKNDQDFTRAETAILPEDGNLIVTTCGRQPDGNPEPEIHNRFYRFDSSLNLIDKKELGKMVNIPGSSHPHCKSFDGDKLKYRATIPYPERAYIPRYHVIDADGKYLNAASYHPVVGDILDKETEASVKDIDIGRVVPFAVSMVTDYRAERYIISGDGELQRQYADKPAETLYTTGESNKGQYAALYGDSVLMVTKKKVGEGHFDTFLTALDKRKLNQSSPLWQIPLSKFNPDIHDGYFRNRPTEPVISQKGTLYVADQDYLTAIDVKSQKPLWQYVMPQNTRPNELVLDHDGKVWMTQCFKPIPEAAADRETRVMSANCQMVVLEGDGSPQEIGSLSDRGDLENTGRLYHNRQISVD